MIWIHGTFASRNLMPKYVVVVCFCFFLFFLFVFFSGQNYSFVKLANFSCLLLNKDFAWAYIGKSTCTRAFTEAL